MQYVGNVIIIKLLNQTSQRFGRSINQCGIAEFLGKLIDDQSLLLTLKQPKQQVSVVGWR